MADLNRFRALGQQFTQGGQNMIKQNVDDPIEAKRREVEQEAQFRQANARGRAALDSGDPTMPAGAMSTGGDEVFPAHPEGLSDSMVAGLGDHANLLARDKQMKEQLMQQAAEQARSEAEFDPSQYKQVNRFQGLQQKLAPPPQVMPEVAAPLPPTMQGGMIELSDDPEEQQRQIDAARMGR